MGITLRVVGQDGKVHAEGQLYQPKAKSAAEKLGEEAANKAAATNGFQQVQSPTNSFQQVEEPELQPEEEPYVPDMVRGMFDAIWHSPNAGLEYQRAISKWDEVNRGKYKTPQAHWEAKKKAFKLDDNGRSYDYPDDPDVLDLFFKKR